MLSQQRQAAYNEGDEWFSNTGPPNSSDSSATKPGRLVQHDVLTDRPGHRVDELLRLPERGVVRGDGVGAWGNSANNSFGNTTPYPGYFLAVKIAWGAGSRRDDQYGRQTQSTPRTSR